MLRLIIVLIFLVASVWLGLAIIQHPGYLLVAYQPWMLQMPLWFAVLALLVFLSIFYIFVISIDRIQFWWFRIKNWLRIRREHKSYSKTQHGLALLIEGRWVKAEKLLLAGVNQSVEPLMNYLGAAKAAQEQGAYDRRDHYIQKAYQAAPDAQLAIGLTQADLELRHDQLEQAAATLNQLRQKSPRHPRVLTLLERVYARLGEWKALYALLPSMRKAKMLNAEQMAQFEKNINIEMLNTSAYASFAEIQKMWNDMPRATRKNPDVVCAYVKQLVRFNENILAEELIRKTLKLNWQAELVAIYSKLPLNHSNRQLVIVGAWLKAYGPQPELLLLLGQLCVRLQLWGKAKDYFEKCLALGPNPAAALAYGQLLEQLGESEEAMTVYRDGLDIYP